MLNEFVILERGLSKAGFPITPRHPDVQSPGKNDALHIRLDRMGRPVEASLLKSDRVASSWTLRNGKHNSFPYVQLKQPLLSLPRGTDWHDKFSRNWNKLSLAGRRHTLQTLADEHPIKPDDWADWPNVGLKNSLQARAEIFERSDDKIAIVSMIIARFLQASNKAISFIQNLSYMLLTEVQRGDAELVEIVRIALVGKKAGDGLVGATLYFDVARGEFSRDVVRRHLT